MVTEQDLPKTEIVEDAEAASNTPTFEAEDEIIWPLEIIKLENIDGVMGYVHEKWTEMRIPKAYLLPKTETVEDA